MALAPEFFVLLGIDIFLAASILTALLDRYLTSILQYVFQASAAAGLGELLLSHGLIGATRVWAGIIYLAFALSSLIGLNIRLAIVRQGMNIASIFSQMMTVPVVMVSALFLSSFLENGGELIFSTASIVTIVAAVAMASLSVFGLLREYSRHGGVRSGRLDHFSSSPVRLPGDDVGFGSDSAENSEQNVPLGQRSAQGEDWEESATKENG